MSTALLDAVVKKNRARLIPFMLAQQCLAWGANFVAVGVDTMLYSDALDQRLAMFKSGKNGPRVKGSY